MKGKRMGPLWFGPTKEDCARIYKNRGPISWGFDKFWLGFCQLVVFE